MLTIGLCLAGGVIGFLVGTSVGFHMDRGSDFPFAPVMTAPAGAAIGAIGGTILGQVLA